MILKLLEIKLFVLFISVANSIIVDNRKNVNVVPPDNAPICIFSRQRTNLDDNNMPSVLTFCSCAILGPKLVITAKSCFIQLNWYIYIVKDTNATTDEIKDFKLRNAYEIVYVYDSTRITIAFTDNIITNKYSTIAFRIKKSPAVNRCYLMGYLTPSNEPVTEKNETLILYKIWRVSGQLVKVPVEVVDYASSQCEAKHSIEQPPLKTDVHSGTMLCILPKGVLFDTCAPDLGAPIFCDNVLMGILSTMINRPPDGIQDTNTNIPLHVPNSCYTPLNQSNIEQYSYIAENLRSNKIDAFIKQVSTRRRFLYNEEGGTASTIFIYKHYSMIYSILVLFLIIYR